MSGSISPTTPQANPQTPQKTQGLLGGVDYSTKYNPAAQWLPQTMLGQQKADDAQQQPDLMSILKKLLGGSQ